MALIRREGPKVGLKIRELRAQRGFSLRVLAERCGMSANAISLIERGENSPTVSSLHQLATALEVPITDFFQEDSGMNAIHVRRGKGVRYRNDGLELENLGSGLPDQKLEPFRLTIEPGSSTVHDPVTHPGQEFVYCLTGEIEYYVGEDRYRLGTGDSLLLEATCPHSWRNSSQAPATILLIFQAAQDQHLARQSHLDV